MILDRFKLTDKVAIVTGGSKGIGRAIAIGLGEVGAKVVVASRTKSLIEETADEIIKKGSDAIAIPVDVRKIEDIEMMADTAVNKFGRIDILVNNAGVGPMKKTIDLTLEEWNEVMDINLKAIFWACKTVGKKMIQQKRGKIINLSSVLGIMASNVSLHYCTSKAGIIQLTRALALEWARFNINVNAIAPGFVDTELTKAQQEDESHSRWFMFKIPFKRLGKPEEIVPLAVLLASAASDYITGETIVIDGGYSIW